jgi:hypothetical protein
MRLGMVTGVVLATGLALGGCGDDGTKASAPAAPAGSGVGTPKASGGGPPTSSCEGTPGDGAGAELSSVEVKRLGDNLQITYQLDAALPEREPASYVVDAWALDGELGHQLSVEVDRRGRVTSSVLTYPEQTEAEVEGHDVETSGSTVVATYPLGMLRDLGDEFKWSATVSIGADTADSCPAVGPDPLQPERVAFPE